MANAFYQGGYTQKAIAVAFGSWLVMFVMFYREAGNYGM